GTLVTDWDNVGRMVWEQRIQPDYAHAAAAAVKAGNDMIMNTPEFFGGALEAIERGLLAESDLDAAVARILRLKFELGLFEDPRHPDIARQLFRRFRRGQTRSEGSGLGLAVVRALAEAHGGSVDIS
ncbi:MAG: glycoside hydrolase family 3 N-terminal domain-containing protein, partial [Propionicimonas sp.]|nr:glycoside hydrolase family 3 N-terminal domain-containing protein [Propionicimonas sp.]